MREILFRGYSTAERMWVYGDLSHTTDKTVHISNENCFIGVKPETVGQYTGLTDKNGKKIFEGDIIDTPDRLIKVVWLKGNAQFDLEFVRYAHNNIIINFKGIEMRDLYSYEVIGNIHDNPELIGGDAND